MYSRYQPSVGLPTLFARLYLVFSSSSVGLSQSQRFKFYKPSVSFPPIFGFSLCVCVLSLRNICLTLNLEDFLLLRKHCFHVNILFNRAISVKKMFSFDSLARGKHFPSLEILYLCSSSSRLNVCSALSCTYGRQQKKSRNSPSTCSLSPTVPGQTSCSLYL